MLATTINQNEKRKRSSKEGTKARTENRPPVEMFEFSK